MARIKIAEVDVTAAGVSTQTSNAVYIPGLSVIETDIPKGPVKCSTLTKFQNNFGKTPFVTAINNGSDIEYIEDISYLMAYELISAGLTVYYEVPLKSGAENEKVFCKTEEELIEALKNDNFWTHLVDRNLYDIRFLTAGSASGKDAAINIAMTKILSSSSDTSGINTRGDSISLIDLNIDTTSIEDIVEDTGLVSSSYAAAFVPWSTFIVNCPRGKKGQDGVFTDNPCFPGSFAYLMAFANSIKTNPISYAIAGTTRGQIPNIVKTVVDVEYGEIDANSLQSRKDGAIAVNPICNIYPYGYIIWGNRTTVKNTSGGLTASSFLNIRNSVSSIKKVLYRAAKRVTFDQNSDVTWFNFKSQFVPLLDQMKNNNGIIDYKIIKQTTSEKATIKALIKIIPIEAVEDFELTVYMTDDTSEVTEA